jgi:hypothetical protein
MDPIVLTCGRVRQTFDVPANRTGETCHCPYCGDPHYVPKARGPWFARKSDSEDFANLATRAARPAGSSNRSRSVIAGLCGFFVGAIAGSGLSEFSSYDRPASSLVLEKLLQQAREEQRQAIEACTQVEARLATARTEQRQIEQERDEALRRIRELQTGLDDAVGRLQRLRK